MNTGLVERFCTPPISPLTEYDRKDFAYTE
jgi:hypothetical protein